LARGGLAGECERKVTWWLWRAFLSRYRTVYRLPPIAHTPLLLSPPLSSSEGSVTFSRAITLPNDQGNASPFSAFCPLSSSLLEPCVCVRRARGRGTRRSKRSCPSAPRFVRSLVRFLCFFVTSFSAERPLCGAITSKRGRVLGHQETANTPYSSAAPVEGRECGRRLGECALPLSHPHERRRARPGAHDL